MNHLSLKKFHDLSSMPQMDTGPIQLVLGEDMPELSPTPLGRLRLVNALKNKFGANYRNFPPAAQALQHFDSESNFFTHLRKAKGLDNG